MMRDSGRMLLLICTAGIITQLSYGQTYVTRHVSGGPSTLMQKSYFYQLGDDMVSGMKSFDMSFVAQYIECFYWSYTHWIGDFMSTSRYLSNVTFYDKVKIDSLHIHSSELARTLIDPVEMLDAMLKTTGFDPSTFSKDSFVISNINNYYSQKYNGIDRPELIFFRSLFDTLGDGLKDRFNGDLFAENDDKEIRSLMDSCAPLSYTTSYIMTTTSSDWYQSSSRYQGSPVFFYQLGDDMVSGMKSFDMSIVGQYIECFYWSYTHWIGDFMSTSRYLSNVTFYDKVKIDNLHIHSSELPRTLMDPVKMLDVMLTTTGFDPSTFSKDSFVISNINNYYSQKYNGIDRPELIFFRSLFDTLGDGLKDRFNGDLFAENDDKEIRSLMDSCAPLYYTISYIMPTTTSNWYPSTSWYHVSPVFFYQLGDDMVSGMKSFDMSIVAQYIECFYWSYTHWIGDFMSSSRYLSNVTFYDKVKIDNLHIHSSELPRNLMDPVEMLDAMLKTTGFDPSTFSKDSFVISNINNYYSKKYNGIDRPELIFFRSLFDTLGDGLKDRFNGDLFAENDDKEIRSLMDSCAPLSYTNSYIMPTTTSNWYPSSSRYHGSPVFFYQLGDDMVSGMKSFDMSIVAQYIECFYWSYTHWIGDFMSSSRYLSNVTFYDKVKIDNLHIHSSELPRALIDPVEMLDAMLMTTGFDPSTFSKESFVISNINNYYSKKYNGIDRPELIFFRSLFDTLGDGLKDRFNGDLFAENDDKEIRSLLESCAPLSYTTSYIMPTTTSNWYPSSSRYQGSPVFFYQLGDDMVSGMKSFDMSIVAQYIECFYWSYTHWIGDFMSTSQYLSNVTFYDKVKIDNLHIHSSELPRTLMDPVEMLDAMLKTTGFDPSTFSKDSFVISNINNYYSQKYNGIDRPELIFFRSLFDTLGDGLKDRFNGDLFAENDDNEIRSLMDSCAPLSYTTSYIMPTTTSNWYPFSSRYHVSPVFFYQLGDDMVFGMKSFDMSIVSQYIECFYWSYTHWIGDFMSTSRYLSNVTFYDKVKIDNLHIHSSELPRTLMDPVEMLDAMLKTTGFDPSTFSKDSFVISNINNYYSKKYNGIDRPELIFFRSLFDTLGDGLKDRFNGDLFAENDDKEIRSLLDSCAPLSYTTSYIMPTTTSNWYPSSSRYHGSPVFFYQLGDDMVSGMKSFDMSIVAQYIECFYWSYTHWIGDFMSTSRYLSNVTFYDKVKIDNLHIHSSELPRTLTDPVEMLDAMLKTTGFDPSTFSKDSFVISNINNYYSQKYNGIDRPELIFFRSLFDTLGDGLKDRFNGDLFAENDDNEIRSLLDSCAPLSYTTSYIMPTTTSNWYPFSSRYHVSPVFFYQLGDDMIFGMKSFDMSIVSQYIECFYWSYTHWIGDFMSTSRYLSNVTFYDKVKIDNLHIHSSELPRTLMDPVEMLDAMLKTSGFDPSTFSKNSFVISNINNYYSQKYNGIDRPELIFFRSLFDTLGDGLKDRFNGDLFAENDDNEIRSLMDSCAPLSYTTSYIMPTTTSNWYPFSSRYHVSPVFFYQLGDDMVFGMKSFDMSIVSQYIECFYWSYTHWIGDFMSTSRYLSNVTFYDKVKIDNLHIHSSELPRTLKDPVEMLDAMLKTTGFDPSTFSKDSFVISNINNYYSQKYNGIDRPELIFFRSLFDTLGDGLKDRFNGDLFAENDDKEIRSLLDSCAPLSYTTSYIMPTTTSNWYPSSSRYHGSPVFFYQLGDDMVSGMKSFDMSIVAQYIECFYWSYTHWIGDFMSMSRYLSNVTFYDKVKIDNLHIHSSELPRALIDPVEMLDAMLKTTGFDPSTFSKDSFAISNINNYYSQKYNGIDRPELIFFRSLFDTLGDGLKDRFNGDLFAENDDKEIRSLMDSCAPLSYTTSYIMTTTSSNWYPSSSRYHGSPVFFYQLGDDMVSGMKSFDMSIVAQYIECFYWSYTHWIGDFMSTSRYLSNVTFYDKVKIDNLHIHSSELTRTLMDPVEMLDVMLRTTGFDPSTFSKDSFVISNINKYYSQKYNGIDRPELIFFRSLFDTLGDGLKDRFNGDLFAENDDNEIRSLMDSCAPLSYTTSYIMTTTSSNWYPSSSRYHGSPVFFYQLGDDMVFGMKSFDMSIVSQYIECFYWSYTHWIGDFMSTSRYLSNVTFYDKVKIDNLHIHSSELPRTLKDPVEMLDAMLKTTGFDPSTFSKDSFVISNINNYYSQKYNGIDRPELIFFRSLFDTLGDGLKDRFNGDLFAENDDKEIRSLLDSCAPLSYTTSYIMPTTTSNWYPSSSRYHGSPVFFYQLGDDMVSGMKSFDMSIVAQYIECFYWSYTHWIGDFMSMSRYLSNVTFYDKVKIDNLHIHSSELPRALIDPVEMLDAMLKTTSFDPSTFSKDSFAISNINNYYSQKYNGIDRPELIFFRSLFDTLGDGLKDRFNGDLFAENDDKEIRSLMDSCAPLSYTTSYIMTTTSSNWYPSSSRYHGSPVFFYQLGDDMVSGMKSFDMSIVAQYIECFYWSYTHWIGDFMSTSRYLSNVTFYDKVKIDNLHIHSSELTRTLMDPVEMLDVMLRTTGFDPSTFSKDSFVISNINKYYSQKYNGIDRPELIFFRSLFDTLGDGLKDRFNGDLFAENDDNEIRSLMDSCAPLSYTTSYIMTTTSSNWYPSSSRYHGSPVFFYQLGDDMVSGMKSFDMSIVAQYIECFYWSYTHWIGDFMSTSRYLSNVTFYDKVKIDNLHIHSSELTRTLMDPVEMLDVMLRTTGFDPSTFSKDSFVISNINKYYSQKYNGIDRPELIFFRSLFDTLGDGLKDHFNGDLFAENDDNEIRSLIDSCAPLSYTTSYIMPTTTSNWHPSSSRYNGSPVFFYQLGDDMVSGMKSFDMSIVSQYIECFYWSYTHWIGDFMSSSRYLTNVTFYDKVKIDNLHIHSSELTRALIDPVEMLDAMLMTTGFDPSTFSKDSFVISNINNYYSQKYNGIDRPELIFFRSLFDTLGDGLKDRFNGDLFAENDDKEIRSLLDSCAPLSYTTSYIMPTTTSNWYPSSSRYHGSPVFFYQLGDDMVSGMKSFDMSIVSQYIECFYWSYTHWIGDFMSTSRYLSNVTFYDKVKIDNLHIHSSELPRTLTDPVEMLDAMLKTSGFDPSTFSKDSFVISNINKYYSQKYNGIDRPELIFFRSLFDTLSDGLKDRFNGDLFAENDDKEIRSLMDSCAPFSSQMSTIMLTSSFSRKSLVVRSGRSTVINLSSSFSHPSIYTVVNPTRTQTISVSPWKSPLLGSSGSGGLFPRTSDVFTTSPVSMKTFVPISSQLTAVSQKTSIPGSIRAIPVYPTRTQAVTSSSSSRKILVPGTSRTTGVYPTTGYAFTASSVSWKISVTGSSRLTAAYPKNSHAFSTSFVSRKMSVVGSSRSIGVYPTSTQAVITSSVSWKKSLPGSIYLTNVNPARTQAVATSSIARKTSIPGSGHSAVVYPTRTTVTTSSVSRKTSVSFSTSFVSRKMSVVGSSRSIGVYPTSTQAVITSSVSWKKSLPGSIHSTNVNPARTQAVATSSISRKTSIPGSGHSAVVYPTRTTVTTSSVSRKTSVSGLIRSTAVYTPTTQNITSSSVSGKIILPGTSSSTGVYPTAGYGFLTASVSWKTSVTRSSRSTVAYPKNSHAVSTSSVSRKISVIGSSRSIGVYPTSTQAVITSSVSWKNSVPGSIHSPNVNPARTQAVATSSISRKISIPGSSHSAVVYPTRATKTTSSVSRKTSVSGLIRSTAVYPPRSQNITSSSVSWKIILPGTSSSTGVYPTTGNVFLTTSVPWKTSLTGSSRLIGVYTTTAYATSISSVFLKASVPGSSRSRSVHQTTSYAVTKSSVLPKTSISGSSRSIGVYPTTSYAVTTSSVSQKFPKPGSSRSIGIYPTRSYALLTSSVSGKTLMSGSSHAASIYPTKSRVVTTSFVSLQSSVSSNSTGVYLTSSHDIQSSSVFRQMPISGSITLSSIRLTTSNTVMTSSVSSLTTTSVQSTTNGIACVPGTGFCVDPDLGSHASNIGLSIYVMMGSFILLGLTLKSVN